MTHYAPVESRRDVRLRTRLHVDQWPKHGDRAERQAVGMLQQAQLHGQVDGTTVSHGGTDPSEMVSY
jgi:hypothetical protein